MSGSSKDASVPVATEGGCNELQTMFRVKNFKRQIRIAAQAMEKRDNRPIKDVLASVKGALY